MRALARRVARDPRVRFLAVGGANTLVGYVLFVALVLLLGEVLHYLVLTVLAYLVGVPVAFALYRRFVWPVRGHVWRDLGRFYGVSTSALALNLVLLPPLIEWVGVPVLLAPVVVVAVNVLVAWFGHSRVSFARPAGPARPRAGPP